MSDQAAKVGVWGTEPLLFIDANVLLNFYVPGRESGMGLLVAIDEHRDVVITTHQLEMEFKSNRQKMLMKAIDAAKAMKGREGGVTAFDSHAGSPAELREYIRGVDNRIDLLVKDLTEALRDASADPVAKTLESVFRAGRRVNLDAIDAGLVDKRRRIEALARRRHGLGYPPGKREQHGCGDGVNWEWIVDCAQELKREVVIVTDDRDYGVDGPDGRPVLNDWLQTEFARRVGAGAQVTVTRRLTEALKRVRVAVKASEEAWERELHETLRREAGDDESHYRYKVSHILGAVYDSRGYNEEQREIRIRSEGAWGIRPE